ncbi:eukaryotic aspartyl protease family protein [Striga asiatica]|uniref:Eukaryotic aspartyl protease family protein n=1 Tax=Striga asiatica TaxID=4170 RepID=A0A5A7Q9U9_STRAF|nr:eukaryotic aspartyl protease family protein [Striga asiatica]
MATATFGTPPQTLSFALTSSDDLTSFPCGANYTCVKCTIDPKDILVFKPDQSNSSSLLYCDDPLLNNTISSDLIPVYTQCISDDSCSHALAEYADDEDGSIATSGVILSKTLTLPKGANESSAKKLNLLVDCTSESEGWPQEKIVVEGVEVKVPTKSLAADENGNRGMMVEAGYTVSVMDERVFEPLVWEFEKQVGKNYTRAKEVEKEFTHKPCYNIDSKGIKGIMPKMGFRFEGGAELVVLVENYFRYWNESVMCMTIWSEDNEMKAGDELDGPAMVLGQWQMQNVYVEYGLAHNRLGFLHKNCSQSS